MNKKLFCLASLAALTLAGCGEKPEPKPDPDPDPQPTDPTVNDLKARFDALGDSYKATLMIPATEEVEAAEVSIIINKYYTSVVDVAAIAGFSSGKYYAVFADPETEGSYEAKWGVYYNSQDEYVEEALLKNQEIDMTTFGYKESRGGFENKGAVAGAINDYLGLSLLGEAFASKNLVVKIDNEAKIVFEYYTTALFKQIAYKVEVSATTETDAALEAWLENREDPVAPYTAYDLSKCFYYQNWTAERGFAGGETIKRFVTKNSMSLEYKNFTGDYADWNGSSTYASIGKGANVPAGVYGYDSVSLDPAADLAALNDRTLSIQAVPAPAGFWVNPNYVNPVSAAYNGFTTLVTEEVIAEFGQAFRVTPETTYEGSDGQTRKVGIELVAYLAELFTLCNVFDEEYQRDGYDFSEISYLDFYFEFEEDAEVEDYSTVSDLFIMLKGKASHKEFVVDEETGEVVVNEETGEAEIVADPEEELTLYMEFYDFGTTVDGYGDALRSSIYGQPAQAAAKDVVVNVGETAAIELQTRYLAGSVSLEFANAEQTNATITKTETGYVVEGLAATDEPLVVNIVINGATVATFTVTVQAATPETFAGYWVCEGLTFELNADGTGTYSDGTNEYTVEFDPETGKITGGTFVSAACFDAEDSSFSWHGANLVCNFSQDSGDQVFSKEFTLSEKQEGFVGTWTAEGGFTIVLAADGTGTYNDGSNTYTIEFDAETGAITGGSIKEVWDGDSLLTLQDGKLNVHLEDEYLENIVNKVFVRQ